MMCQHILAAILQGIFSVDAVPDEFAFGTSVRSLGLDVF